MGKRVDSKKKYMGARLDLMNVASVIDKELYCFFETRSGDPQSRDIENPEPFRMSDQLILKRLFNEADYDRTVRGSLKDLFVATFILRFRITELSLVGHATAIGGPIAGTAMSYLFRGEGLILGDLFPRSSQTEWWRFMWNRKIFPVFGFSAFGCHVIFQHHKLCRAFDYYDLLSCGHKRDGGPFCNKHRQESWWVHPLQRSASVQAKMFAYYSNIHHIDEYGEGELRELVDWFWKKVESFQPMYVPSDYQVETALEFFGYLDRKQHRMESINGLKRRFWDRAKVLHPDKGGSEEQFKTLSMHYEVLRALV